MWLLSRLVVKNLNSSGEAVGNPTCYSLSSRSLPKLIISLWSSLSEDGGEGCFWFLPFGVPVNSFGIGEAFASCTWCCLWLRVQRFSIFTIEMSLNVPDKGALIWRLTVLTMTNPHYVLWAVVKWTLWFLSMRSLFKSTSAFWASVLERDCWVCCQIINPLVGIKLTWIEEVVASFSKG